MIKTCKCGNILSDATVPNRVVYWTYLENEWDIKIKAILGQGRSPLNRSVWHCNKCGRLLNWEYGEDRLYKYCIDNHELSEIDCNCPKELYEEKLPKLYSYNDFERDAIYDAVIEGQPVVFPREVYFCPKCRKIYIKKNNKYIIYSIEEIIDYKILIVERKRIDSIQWSKLGTNQNEKISNLGYEYLRRLAEFCEKEKIELSTPISLNIVAVCTTDEDYLTPSCYYFGKNKSAIEAIENRKAVKNIVIFYMELVNYSINHPEIKKYLNVYEPMIKLLEVGGDFVIEDNKLKIKHGDIFPLDNWYENYADADEIDISEFYENSTDIE